MENKKPKKQISLTRKLFRIGWPLNMLDAAILFLYILLASGIYYNLSSQETIRFTLIMIIIGVITQFGLGLLSNYLLTRKLSERIEKDRQGYYTAKERTLLIKDLTKLPKFIGLEVDAGFLIAFLVATIYLNNNYDISNLRFIFYLIMGCEGITTAGIYAHLYTEKVCEKYVEEIAERGISPEMVEKDHHWGLMLNYKILLFIIIPYAMLCLSEFVYMFFSPITEGTYSIKSLAIVIVASTSYIIFIAFLLHQYIYNTATKINDTLMNLQAQNKEAILKLPMTFNSDLSYNIYLINQIIDYVEKISNEAVKCTNVILETTKKLSETAEVTELSVNEKVDEIKLTIQIIQHTIESLSKTNNFVNEITEATVNSKISIENCSRNITNYRDRMLLIQNANNKTNEAIIAFSERIETAWSIINKIEDIAQKTKIIAYNAELEADTTGIKGDKLHIISLEIRRLSITIEEASEQIKEKIVNVQNSSDNLIIKSEAGTLKIQEETKAASELVTNFKEVITCDNITHESASKIQECIDNQKQLIDNLNESLSNINQGFDYFAESSKRINSISQNLNLISRQLNHKKGTTNA